MIHGLFNIIQQDSGCVMDYLKGQGTPSQDQKHKVNMAAVRVLAGLGMAFAVVTGLKIFSAASVGAVLFKLATAVAIYAVCHDAFIIAQNAEKEAIDKFMNLLGSTFADIADLLNGRKNSDDFPRHPLAEGTLLRPVWDVVLAGQE